MPNYGADQYRFVVPNRLDQNQVIARVDYSLTEKDRISARYFLNNVPQIAMPNGSGSSVDSDWISTLPARFQNTTLMYTHIFSPTMVNDLRASYIQMLSA